MHEPDEIHETAPIGSLRSAPSVRPPPASAPVGEFGPPIVAGDAGRLGPYRIVSPLGRGAMGAVYAAIDTRLDRKVALKVMLPNYAADPIARQRFLREARAAAAVTHDHIVTIYEADLADGRPFIAMQFLEGCTLDQFLRTQGGLPLDLVLRVGLETALGLEAAHAAGLVHRDIKPGNLWLEAPHGRVKILDFGLAKSAAGEAELTHTGAVLGTPAYMSPEQARGLEIDARSDLFSLGSVLYRACSGKLPFEGGSTMAVLMALGTENPPPLATVVPSLPAAAVELIHRLMAKAPHDRPQTAAEVVSCLRSIIRETQPTDAAVPSIPSGDPSRVRIAAFPEGDPFVPAAVAHGDVAATQVVAGRPAAAAPSRWMIGLIGGGVLIAAVLVARPLLDAWPARNRPVDALEGSAPPAVGDETVAVGSAPAGTDVDERQAAERILAVGGVLLLEGQSQGIGRVEDLPAEPFRITSVRIRDQPIADDDLRQLGSLEGLSYLDLSRTPIDGSGLRHLRDLPSLRILNLSDTRITDANLQYVGSMRGLGMLDLGRTGVTDLGLQSLGALQEADSIVLDGTQVTSQGVETLRGQLPGCTVHWEPPPP